MRIRRLYWVLGAITFTVLALVVGIALVLRVPFSSETLRQQLIDNLSDRLEAHVELGELTIRVLPTIHVRGTRLVIYQRGRTDVPPLISMDSFTVDAGFMNLWRQHINRMRVEGLAIQIVPSDQRSRGIGSSESRSGRDFVIDELTADSSTLTIIPRNPEKKPRLWRMHQLRIERVGIDQEMPFQSLLTNAVPPGRITTKGAFGPWDVDDPGSTPVDGEFTLEDADLSVFKGISGMLSARGHYGGSLERIDVMGATDTPDFMVNISRHPVPLTTTYHATVDGTNGDTMLERVDGHFLNTSLVATGGVYTKPGVTGRTVSLEVTMDEARLEDLMRLTVNTPNAPMKGALSLRTKFELPPGDRDVVEKLLLDGRFAIGNGRFTDPGVRRQIAELSRRASGKPGAEGNTANVDSDFTGRFRLGRGILTLPSVTFDVPGAAVQLAGRYNLQRETIAFAGDLFMDAKISQTTTGWKSLLLKVVDPLFRRDGRTVVPIKVEGTRSAPHFGLDSSRVFKRGNSKPGAKPAPGDEAAAR